MVKIYSEEEVKRGNKLLKGRKYLLSWRSLQMMICYLVHSILNPKQSQLPIIFPNLVKVTVTSKIDSIDNGYTKLSHTDCNISASGSVMFIKVVPKCSSAVQPDDNNTDMSKVKLFSLKSKEVSIFQSPNCDFTSTNKSSESLLKDSIPNLDAGSKSKENITCKELT